MLTPPDGALGGLDPDALFAQISDADTIGLAVSGGADSLALMVLYAAWKPSRRKPDAIVYSVDHRLRRAARDEVEMVAACARRLGLPVRTLAWEAPRPKSGVQAGARAARYRLIGEAMARDGASVLLTAHHRRDQAETVLMRLAHASGVSGLGAMRDFASVHGVALYRPLLDVDPDVLATVAARAKMVPARDPSNADPAYERTRWRNALPALAALGLTEQRLTQAAARMRRVDDLARAVTRDLLRAHASLDALGAVTIDRMALSVAHEETVIRVLAAALGVTTGTAPRALGKLETLAVQIMDGQVGATTVSGARLVMRNDLVIVHREAARIDRTPIAVEPGQRLTWDGRFTIGAAPQVLRIVPGHAMTRAQFETLTGHRLGAPVAALRAAPVIEDANGAIVAIGAHVISSDIEIGQPALTC